MEAKSAHKVPPNYCVEITDWFSSENIAEKRYKEFNDIFCEDADIAAYWTAFINILNDCTRSPWSMGN
ncbi:MAG: hypothetical protein FWD05_07890 [Oscillospiraceae bacterium]|nr:hypothetical protein [Oscillospiraceae bacterium]